MVKSFKCFFSSLILIFACVVTNSVKAQEAAYEGEVGIYSKLYQGGILVHTNGFGINFKQSISKTAFIWKELGINISTLKHPKEYKQPSFYNIERSRYYVFGKDNSVILIRPFYGRRKIIFDKRRKRGVEGAYILAAGPSLGIAKPIYYHLNDPSSLSDKYVRFNDDLQTNDIRGKAPSLYGIENTTFHPGVFTKLGFSFEYSNDKDRVKAIEVGAAVDFFPLRPIPIMGNIKNNRVNLNFYVSLQYGKKFYR